MKTAVGLCTVASEGGEEEWEAGKEKTGGGVLLLYRLSRWLLYLLSFGGGVHNPHLMGD